MKSGAIGSNWRTASKIEAEEALSSWLQVGYKFRIQSDFAALAMTDPKPLRQRLIETALEWERTCGVAPSITSAISEFDAAMLVGMSADEYGLFMRSRTAVARGVDFEFGGIAYQVKANRPSGKPGSAVTLVAKAHPNSKTGLLEWDRLIWILYDELYAIQEAWLWEREAYGNAISPLQLARPIHMRNGQRIEKGGNLLASTSPSVSTAIS